MEQGRESLLEQSAIKFNSKKRDGLNRDISL